MNVVFRILRYLKSAPRKGLEYSQDIHAGITRYYDLDLGAKEERRHLTTGTSLLLEVIQLFGKVKIQ